MQQQIKAGVTPQVALNQLQQVNLELWERVHKFEFLLEQELGKKEKDERRFRRKLVRLAKYLDMRGLFKEDERELPQLLVDQESK